MAGKPVSPEVDGGGGNLHCVLLVGALEHVFLFWVPECLLWLISGRGGGHVWDHLVLLQVAKLRSNNMP